MNVSLIPVNGPESVLGVPVPSPSVQVKTAWKMMAVEVEESTYKAKMRKIKKKAKKAKVT